MSCLGDLNSLKVTFLEEVGSRVVGGRVGRAGLLSS